MTVRYHQRHGAELPDYICQKSKIEHAGQMCQQIPDAGVDTAIGQLLIDPDHDQVEQTKSHEPRSWRNQLI